MQYFKNVKNVIQSLERFAEMKLSILEKLKENKLKVKETDLTRIQTIVINYILSGKNWMKTKTKIATETKTSRVTVDKCYDLLETIYDEIIEMENKK